MKLIIFYIVGIFAASVALASDWPSTTARGSVAFDLVGISVTGTIVGVQVPWSMTVPANYTAANTAAASQCNCRVAPTSDFVMSIKKYAQATPGTAVSEGSCTVSAATLIGTFASNAAYTLSPGDTLAIISPTQDATASDCHVTIGTAQ